MTLESSQVLEGENVLSLLAAGAAGPMASRELGRAGKTVTILEARDRCGGRRCRIRLWRGPITHGLLREAGLSLLPVPGAQWNAGNGAFSRDEQPGPQTDQLHLVLAELKRDMTGAEFLQKYFCSARVQSFTAFHRNDGRGLRRGRPDSGEHLGAGDEWMNSGLSAQARIAGGYGALIDFLTAECRKLGAAIHLFSNMPRSTFSLT